MTEYNTLGRKDLMSLSTISKEEVLGRPLISYKTRDIMRNGDIDGSKPQIAGYKYINKASYNNINQDIEGSCSRKLFTETVRSTF